MQSFSLQPHPILTAPSGPVLLLILDGLGIGKTDGSNAWHLAQTPFLDSLKDQPIYTTLAAHGKAVGMPSHTDMGNSEVGHNTLGSGRIIKLAQPLSLQDAVDKTKVHLGLQHVRLSICE